MESYWSLVGREIGIGETRQAIDKLWAFFPNNKAIPAIVLLKSRIYNLEKSYQNGVITFEEYNLQKNKITKSLIDIVNALDDGNLDVLNDIKSFDNPNPNFQNLGVVFSGGNNTIKTKNFAGNSIHYNYKEKWSIGNLIRFARSFFAAKIQNKDD